MSFTGLLQINSLNPQSLASAETVASSSPIPASNTENSGAYHSTGGRENDLHHLSVYIYILFIYLFIINESLLKYVLNNFQRAVRKSRTQYDS